MNIFIIHYTKLAERKQSIESFIHKLDSPVTYITECDQEELTLESVKKVYEPDQLKWDKKVEPLWDKNMHRPRLLNFAEISVAIKQLLAVKRIASSNEIGLVLEDDALPVTDLFNKELSNLLGRLPEKWDAIFIGEGCGLSFINNHVGRSSPVVGDNLFKAKHPATNCAEAYLLTPQAAKKIIDETIPFQLAWDWELAHTFYKLDMNVYWTVPPIFRQGSKIGTFNSSIR